MASPGAIPRVHSPSATLKALDDLDWTCGFAFEAYGVRIGVRSNSAALAEHLKARLPFGAAPFAGAEVDRLLSVHVRTSAGRAVHLFHDGGDRQATVEHLAEVLEVFESEARVAMAALATERIFLHAGVAAWNGRAVVLPGRSFSGKTTLVAELVRAGAVYYSDEYAAFDREGNVYPFLKPLDLRAPGESRQVPVDVSALGGLTGTGPCPVGLVLLARHRARATWHTRLLSPGQGVLAMMEHAVAARQEPAAVMTALQSVARRAPAFRVLRGEAAASVPRILEMLQDRATAHAPTAAIAVPELG